MFYESNLIDPPFWNIPSCQYGPWGVPDDGHFGNWTTLEPARPFLHSGYAWRGIVVPKTAQQPVSGNQQIEYRAQVPPRSWLVALSGFSSIQAAGGTPGGAPGFAFSIFDEGTKRFVGFEGFERSATGVQDNTDTDPALPYVLAHPYCVIAPGWLQIRIKNASASSNQIHLVLHFAVPGNPPAPYSSKAGAV